MIDPREKEYLAHKAARTIGEYFAEEVFKNSMNKKVAVLVDDFTKQLLYIDCDELGYPIHRSFKWMQLSHDWLTTIRSDNATPFTTTGTIEETWIELESPMLVNRYYPYDQPIVYMWKGIKRSTRKVPVESLDVSELMKLAQNVITSREGIILDKALENKLFK